MHPPAQLSQQAGKGRTRIFPQGVRFFLFQDGIDVRGREKTGSPLTGLRETETGTDHLLGRRHPIERTVGFLDGGLFFLAEPAAFSLPEFMNQLGIKPGMVNGGHAVDGSRNLHADKPAAPGQIREQVPAVARTDERSDTRQRFGRPPVGTAHPQIFHLHEILQLRHARRRQAVEFVQVDEPVRGQLVFGGRGVCQVKTFREVRP